MECIGLLNALTMAIDIRMVVGLGKRACVCLHFFNSGGAMAVIKGVLCDGVVLQVSLRTEHGLRKPATASMRGTGTCVPI